MTEEPPKGPRCVAVLRTGTSLGARAGNQCPAQPHARIDGRDLCWTHTKVVQHGTGYHPNPLRFVPSAPKAAE